MNQRAHIDSSAIVDFLSRLSPLYVDEMRESQRCARSLRDGTLICPLQGPEGDEDHWVEVLWQGVDGRRSVVHAATVAQLAIHDYAHLHSRGKPERYRDELEHLIEHFRVKTGASVEVPGDQVVEVFGVIGKLAKKLGWAGLLAALKGLS